MNLEEKKKYMLAEEQKKELEKRVRDLEFQLFPENYDQVGDSMSDSKMRKQGKNPMSAEYTAKVNARRVKLGVTPLGENGLPVDNSAFQYCINLLSDKINHIPKTVQGQKMQFSTNFETFRNIIEMLEEKIDFRKSYGADIAIALVEPEYDEAFEEHLKSLHDFHKSMNDSEAKDQLGNLIFELQENFQKLKKKTRKWNEEIVDDAWNSMDWPKWITRNEWDEAQNDMDLAVKRLLEKRTQWLVDMKEDYTDEEIAEEIGKYGEVYLEETDAENFRKLLATQNEFIRNVDSVMDNIWSLLAKDE